MVLLENFYGKNQITIKDYILVLEDQFLMKIINKVLTLYNDQSL